MPRLRRYSGKVDDPRQLSFVHKFDTRLPTATESTALSGLLDKALAADTRQLRANRDCTILDGRPLSSSTEYANATRQKAEPTANLLAKVQELKNNGIDPTHRSMATAINFLKSEGFELA